MKTIAKLFLALICTGLWSASSQADLDADLTHLLDAPIQTSEQLTDFRARLKQALDGQDISERIVAAIEYAYLSSMPVNLREYRASQVLAKLLSQTSMGLSNHSNHAQLWHRLSNLLSDAKSETLMSAQGPILIRELRACLSVQSRSLRKFWRPQPDFTFCQANVVPQFQTLAQLQVEEPIRKNIQAIAQFALTSAATMGRYSVPGIKASRIRLSMDLAANDYAKSLFSSEMLSAELKAMDEFYSHEAKLNLLTESGLKKNRGRK